MDSPMKEIEVEHENLILGKKLIELYELRIKELETKILELELLLNRAPVPIPNTPFPKPKIRTMNELIRALEVKSAQRVENSK